ncbi:MAG: hypothetical protein ACLQU3_19060 [Limisphaerales bacterium]
MKAPLEPTGSEIRALWRGRSLSLIDLHMRVRGSPRHLVGLVENWFQIACHIVKLAILEKVYIASMIGLIGAGCAAGLGQAIGKEVGQMAGGIFGNPNITWWGRRPPPPPPPDSWPVIIAKAALMTIPLTVIVLFFVLHPWTD